MLILIQDDFFANIDEIRKFAINLNYQEPKSIDYRSIGLDRVDFLDNWRGYRHWIDYSKDNKNHTKIFSFICDSYNLNMNEYTLKLCFHYYTNKTKKTCFPSFDEYKFHRDSDTSVYAGLIYLNPNPPTKTGTTIIDEFGNKHDIENVYNRFVCYPSNLLHAPTDLFGNDIIDGRLTLIYFLEKLL